MWRLTKANRNVWSTCPPAWGLGEAVMRHGTSKRLLTPIEEHLSSPVLLTLVKAWRF
jgi:hypothetical protein